jgi:hypothetical protein
MQPLSVAAPLECFVDPYPSVASVLAALKSEHRHVPYALGSLWLSEGIPFAFRENPAIYDALRVWLSRSLGIEAKELTLIGSGRQGYSLSPNATFGRAFGSHSDLDFSAVSGSLFARLRTAYESWERDYAKGLVAPRHERERNLWNENKRVCPGGLARGFLDPHKIPTWKRYPEAQKTMDALWRANEKLKITLGAPSIRRISLRVYVCWNSLVGQIATTLEAVARYKARGAAER